MPEIRQRISAMVDASPETIAMKKLRGYKNWEDMATHSKIDHNMYTFPFFFDGLRDLDKEWYNERDYEERPIYSKRVFLEGNTLIQSLVRFFQLKDGDILRDPVPPVIWTYDEVNGVIYSKRDPKNGVVYDKDVLVRKGSPE